jgi:hypothetical protein
MPKKQSDVRLLDAEESDASLFVDEVLVGATVVVKSCSKKEFP